MSSFKAIIFDLDGTLLDTLDDLTDSMNSVLTSLGHPVHQAESYKYFIGEGVNKLAERALPKGHRSGEEIEVCAEMMIKEYGKRWAAKTRVYDGVPQLLDELKNNKIICAVLSNKPHLFTKKAVERFIGNWPFAMVAGALPEVPRKPDPAGALAVANKLNIAPEDFVYVGDSNTDMQTALAAKMYPAAALWGFRTKSELESAGAKSLLNHPHEILELFHA